jgi:hypothetical protein
LLRKPIALGATELARADPKLAAALAKGIEEMTLTYPPERRPFTRAEEDALRKLKLTRVDKSALRKFIAEACASTMFNFLCVMDAVGDPGVAVKGKRWLGASFSALGGRQLHA